MTIPVERRESASALVRMHVRLLECHACPAASCQVRETCNWYRRAPAAAST